MKKEKIIRKIYKKDGLLPQKVYNEGSIYNINHPLKKNKPNKKSNECTTYVLLFLGVL